MRGLVDWGYYLSWAALILGGTFILGALAVALAVRVGHG